MLLDSKDILIIVHKESVRIQKTPSKEEFKALDNNNTSFSKEFSHSMCKMHCLIVFIRMH